MKKKKRGKRKEDLIYCNKLLQNSMCLGRNCQISENYSIRYEKLLNCYPEKSKQRKETIAYYVKRQSYLTFVNSGYSNT